MYSLFSPHYIPHLPICPTTPLRHPHVVHDFSNCSVVGAKMVVFMLKVVEPSSRRIRMIKMPACNIIKHGRFSSVPVMIWEGISFEGCRDLQHC